MNEQVIAGYEHRMRQALLKGNFSLFENIKSQYERALQTREHVPAKVITDTMTPGDKETCDKLLRKIPVLADIIEGAGVDLLSLLKKYDKSVTLPMMVQLHQLTYIAKSLRSIIDKVGNEEFAVSFGDVSDRINDAIDECFKIDLL